MEIEIALVKCDNGQGLYVSEKLVFEDHQVTVEAVMAHTMHKHIDGFRVYHASPTWVDVVGAFTPALRDIVLEDGRTLMEHWETE